MTKNPLLSALGAFGYIVLVVAVMNYLMSRFKDTPDTMVTPIIPLSLFTLSAAVMGYIFLSQPLQLFIDGKKKEGLQLFIQTVGVFAGITTIILILVSTGLIA